MRRADLIAGSAFAVVVAVAATFANPFWLDLLTKATIFAVIYLSVGVIYDNAGLLSLCQMSFAGIGAWTMGTLAERVDLPYLVMLPIAGLVALVVGVLVGAPALRLRGQNLAVFTLVFSAAVAHVVFAGGFPGLITGNRVSRPGFASGDAGFFVFAAVVLGAVGITVTAMRRSRVGRWWWSARRSERATAAMGRSVVRTKLTAFATSAAIAGIGGGLLVADNGTVSASSFEPFDSMTVLTAALMFGAGHFEGAVIAGLLGELIPTVLRNNGLSPDLGAMIFAVGGVAALAKGEGGLAGALRGLLVGLRSGRDDGNASTTGGGPSADPAEAHAADQPITSITPATPTLATGTALTIVDAGVSYGMIRALDGVSFDVDAGSLVALIGPNGAGKSTLIDLLSGFITDHEGTVLLDGHDLTGLPPRRRARRGLRRSFQQGHTPHDLTIGGYLDLAAPDGATTIDDALRFFSLPAATTPIATLDVGTRRILEVCGVARSQPTVALLDEPAAGLSGVERDRFVAAIGKISSTFGSAIVLVEHDLDVVSKLCETVHVLDFGRLIASGPPSEVLHDPDVVAAYLGAPT